MHCLQTATLTRRRVRDLSLLHHIGDTLSSRNHPDIAAAMLKPFVSQGNVWMMQHHAIFRGYYFLHNMGLDPNTRDRLLEQPELFERITEFCGKYDA